LLFTIATKKAEKDISRKMVILEGQLVIGQLGDAEDIFLASEVRLPDDVVPEGLPGQLAIDCDEWEARIHPPQLGDSDDILRVSEDLQVSSPRLPAVDADYGDPFEDELEHFAIHETSLLEAELDVKDLMLSLHQSMRKTHGRWALFLPKLVHALFTNESVWRFVEIMYRFCSYRMKNIILMLYLTEGPASKQLCNLTRLATLIGEVPLETLLLHGNCIPYFIVMLSIVSLCQVRDLSLVFHFTTIVNEKQVLALQESLRGCLSHQVRKFTVSSYSPEIILLGMSIAMEMLDLKYFEYYLGTDTPMDVDWRSSFWQLLADSEKPFPKLMIDFGASQATVRESYLPVLSNNTTADALVYQRWAFSSERYYVQSAKLVLNALYNLNTTISRVEFTGRNMSMDLVETLSEFVQLTESVSSICISYDKGCGPMPEEQSLKFVAAVRFNYNLRYFECRFANSDHMHTISMYLILNKMGRYKLHEENITDYKKQSIAIELMEAINAAPCAQLIKQNLQFLLLQENEPVT